MWRSRNQFLVSAASNGKTHAIQLYIYIRDHELDYFNVNSSSEARESRDFLQEILELLDTDTNFQQLLADMKDARSIDTVIKAHSTTQHKLRASTFQFVWSVIDSGGGISTILEWHEGLPNCKMPAILSLIEQETEIKDNAANALSSGSCIPLGLRKLALLIRLYPPSIVIPEIGEFVPENPHCVTSFF